MQLLLLVIFICLYRGTVLAESIQSQMKGGESMKKLMRVFIAILFALSMTGLCFAQAQAPAPAKGGVLPETMEKPVQKPTPEEMKKMKEERAEKKKAKKAKKAEKKAKKAEAKKKGLKEVREPLPESMEKTPGQGGKQEVK